VNELFRAVSDRLKAVLTAHAALELEAELIARHVERKAELLRKADQLEGEGMAELAAELRGHAGRTDLNRPAEAVLPALNAPKADNPERQPGDGAGENTTATRKKGR
jgi:hypothetical protein